MRCPLVEVCLLIGRRLSTTRTLWGQRRKPNYRATSAEQLARAISLADCQIGDSGGHHRSYQQPSGDANGGSVKAQMYRRTRPIVDTLPGINRDMPPYRRATAGETVSLFIRHVTRAARAALRRLNAYSSGGEAYRMTADVGTERSSTGCKPGDSARFV